LVRKLSLVVSTREASVSIDTFLAEAVAHPAARRRSRQKQLACKTHFG
jgi:hypothetical protein